MDRSNGIPEHGWREGKSSKYTDWSRDPADEPGWYNMHFHGAILKNVNEAVKKTGGSGWKAAFGWGRLPLPLIKRK